MASKVRCEEGAGGRHDYILSFLHILFTHDCCEETRVLKAQLKRVPALDARLPYMHLRESLQEEKLAPPHHIQTR